MIVAEWAVFNLPAILFIKLELYFHFSNSSFIIKSLPGAFTRRASPFPVHRKPTLDVDKDLVEST